MSPLLVVGHRLTPHRLHRRPLAARLPVIVICLPHIRVSERSESTILTLSFGGCAAGTYQHQAAQTGSLRRREADEFSAVSPRSDGRASPVKIPVS